MHVVSFAPHKHVVHTHVSGSPGLRVSGSPGVLTSMVCHTQVSKVKLIGMLAGAHRHCDIFIVLGDYLALREWRPPFEEGERRFWIPELQTSQSPGTMVSNFIKGLLIGGMKRFQRVWVAELPESAAAGGIRPGACNTMGKYMPGELIAHLSGHKLEGLGSVFDYVDVDRALCIPGGVVLAGWPAFPWSNTGEGPVPPSLEPLLQDGEPLSLLEAVMDALFKLTGSKADPPQLLRGGSLRPLLHHCFASMVMYYEERKLARPMEGQTVIVMMMDAVRDAFSKQPEVTHLLDPDDQIIKWGKLIRMRFNEVNLHLSSRSGETGIRQTAFSITTLGTRVGELTDQLRRLTTGCQTLEAQVRRIEQTNLFALSNQAVMLGGLASICMKLGLEQVAFVPYLTFSIFYDYLTTTPPPLCLHSGV